MKASMKVKDMVNYLQKFNPESQLPFILINSEDKPSVDNLQNKFFEGISWCCF